MEQLVKNKAYELGGRTLVFRSMNEHEAEFLEYYKDKEGKEAMKEVSISLGRLSLEGDILKMTKEGLNFPSCYNWNEDSEFDSKEHFQNLLNQYNNAII